MRVLVTGATGFIGHALARALARDGHDVIAASRHGDLAVDFAHVPPASWWAPHLAQVDAVVNTVGVLREQPGQSFDALHSRAPIELFRACAQANVRYVVQLSSLGADESAQTAYHLSKKVADDALRALATDAAIVQPSLVYGPGGASARLFDVLAASPVLMLPRRGTMLVQPVHVDDVIAGIVALLRTPMRGAVTIAFVGPRALTLREYLARLRDALGIGGHALVLPFPLAPFRAFAAAAGRMRHGYVDSDTAAMLLRGNHGDAAPFERLLGRAPKPVDEFVPAHLQDALRTRAQLGVWLPVLRLSIAALWIWTAAVSFGLYPAGDSLALLARVGLHGGIALLALYGAAALDLLLGVLTLVLPAHRRGVLWAAQLLLMAGYTLLITLFVPEYWLHPFGPISKNLPVAASIALLWAIEGKRRR
jgi:uncharacterized protein YbjT (DUF2867 family)